MPLGSRDLCHEFDWLAGGGDRAGGGAWPRADREGGGVGGWPSDRPTEAVGGLGSR